MLILGDYVTIDGRQGEWYIAEFLTDEMAYLVNLNPNLPATQANVSDLTLLGD